MDSNLLFWLFLAAIYILQAMASRKKNTGEPPVDGTPEAQQEMPSELELALGEIGRVLRGEVEGPSAPQPVPTQRRAPEPTAAPTKAPTSRELERTAQRPRPSMDSREGRLTQSPIFYDQAFEDRTADTFKAPIITHDHVFAFSDPKEAQQARRSAEEPVQRPDLRDHMVSRQSFIAAELLAPPLSKRGRTR